jgi:uncharacterized protein YndB with AHSA1/START domain
MKVQRSVEIAATPEKIWPYLVEAGRIPEWFNLLRKFEYTGDKRRGVGATFYYEEKSGGQLLEMNYTVTEWVENERLGFKVTSGSLKKDDQVWSIDSIPSGSRFTMFEDLEMPMGAFGKVIGVLFGDMMIGRNMKKILANLKRMAEA